MVHPGYQVLSDILFRLDLIVNALTLCSSLVLALYGPFGVDVPLNFDITHNHYLSIRVHV